MSSERTRPSSGQLSNKLSGTNEFQSNVILTAAGGSSGQAQGKGDGGVAWLARLQAPRAAGSDLWRVQQAF